MGQISIAGLNKADVLAALYNAAKPQGMGFMHYNSAPMTREQAEALLKDQDYFDYLIGRVMKISLAGEEIDTRLYDRDNGEGAAERVIRSLRAMENTNTPVIQHLHRTGVESGAAETMGGLMEASGPQQDPRGVPEALAPKRPVVYRLGLSDVADRLKPRIAEAVHRNRSK